MTVNFPYPLINKLNSLKSPWMSPLDANFLTSYKDFKNISLTEQFYPIFLTLHKGSPSIKDMTIAWRLVSIGLGVGKPSSCKICIKVNSRMEESLDKYNQLKLVLFWIYYLLFLIVLNDLRPNLVSFNTICEPSTA